MIRRMEAGCDAEMAADKMQRVEVWAPTRCNSLDVQKIGGRGLEGKSGRMATSSAGQMRVVSTCSCRKNGEWRKRERTCLSAHWLEVAWGKAGQGPRALPAKPPLDLIWKPNEPCGRRADVGGKTLHVVLGLSVQASSRSTGSRDDSACFCRLFFGCNCRPSCLTGAGCACL
jgi:hypothetical protein